MNGNLTLDRIIAPLPDPEFVTCARCPRTLLSIHTRNGVCSDCQVVDKITTRRQKDYGAVHPFEPAFEVTVHYSSKRYQRGNQQAVRTMINRAGFPYLASCVDADPIARRWLSDVLGHYSWPVVTVTSYGRLLAHWAGEQVGLQPDRYTQLQGLYEQVQSGTAKPLYF